MKLHCGNLEAAGSHSKQQGHYISEDIDTFWKFAEPKDALCRILPANINHSFVQGAGKTGLFVQLKVTVGLIYFRHVKVRC